MEHTVLGSKSRPIPLVNPDGGCYIPRGVGIIGGDDLAMNGLSQQLHTLEGFIIQKYHVTNRDYIVFLNDLVDQGKESEALLYAPKRGDQQSDQTLYERDENGRFPTFWYSRARVGRLGLVSVFRRLGLLPKICRMVFRAYWMFVETAN